MPDCPQTAASINLCGLLNGIINSSYKSRISMELNGKWKVVFTSTSANRLFNIPRFLKIMKIGVISMAPGMNCVQRRISINIFFPLNLKRDSAYPVSTEITTINITPNAEMNKLFLKYVLNPLFVHASE